MNFLLLRGLIRERRHWGRFPEILQGRIPGASVHFLDFPGIGTEADRASPSSVRDIRQDIGRRFDEKRKSGEFPGGPWTLFAVSLGAMVGLDWIADPNQPFERAVFVNTSARDVGFFWDRFRLSALPGMARSLIDFRPEVYERVILQATSNLPGPARFADLDTHVSWRREQPILKRTFFAQLYAASRFKLPAEVRVPGLMLLSEKDRLVAPTLSEKIAHRYRFEIRRHLWGGHDLPKDDPEWIATEVLRYLQDEAVVSA